MNQRPFVRQIVYLLLILVLLVPLSLLSIPSRPGRGTEPGSPGGKLAQLRTEHRLGQANLGEIDPTGETIKLATLGMRGVATNILWSKANKDRLKENWTAFAATLDQITKLQPNFITVWIFQGWNLSYNISAEFDDYRDRYYWVIKGTDFLKEGTRYNENSPDLLWNIGWTIAQKIGRADEHKEFRVMFREDNDFHGTRPLDQRDNWLVGREWFLDALDAWKLRGPASTGKSPLLMHKDPPQSLINYAESLEEDGIYGEKARLAWENAERAWREYGATEIPTYDGTTLRLTDLEALAARSKETEAELDNLVGKGIRDEIRADRRAKLTDQERNALDTDPAERDDALWELVATAEPKIAVTHQDVADRASKEKQAKAKELVDQLAELDRSLQRTESARDQINYQTWLTRCQLERTPQALEARRLIVEAERAFDANDTTAAKNLYDQAFSQWKAAFDQFPTMIDDGPFREDIVANIDDYQKVLAQREEKLPADFILNNVLEKSKKPY